MQGFSTSQKLKPSSVLVRSTYDHTQKQFLKILRPLTHFLLSYSDWFEKLRFLVSFVNVRESLKTICFFVVLHERVLFTSSCQPT